MKLSDLKEHIIKEFGERGWKHLKDTEAYRINRLTKEKQLEKVKKDPFNIELIHNPTEELQLEAIKARCFMLERISNPSRKVIIKAIGEAEDIEEASIILKHIENDLDEE